MAKIRRTIISGIYLAIQNTEFSLRDFKIDFEETEHFVYIQFLPFPEYEFEIVERNMAKNIPIMLDSPEPDYKLFTIEAPGEYKTRASQQLNSIEECIGRISIWCKNIKEELSAPMPKPSVIESFEEELEKGINEKAGDSKEKFTYEEATSLKEKLDFLSQKFVELEAANSITEKELLSIKTEVERMKDNLSLYPKSTWYKVSGHKVLDILNKLSKSKEGKDLLLSSAKKFLGLE